MNITHKTKLKKYSSEKLSCLQYRCCLVQDKRFNFLVGISLGFFTGLKHLSANFATSQLFLAEIGISASFKVPVNTFVQFYMFSRQMARISCSFLVVSDTLLPTFSIPLPPWTAFFFLIKFRFYTAYRHIAGYMCKNINLSLCMMGMLRSLQWSLKFSWKKNLYSLPFFNKLLC